MVRVFIKNGPCGAESFFKIIGVENNTYILQECIGKPSTTFCELQERFKDVMNKSTLSKRLAELINAGLLDKIRYTNAKPSYTVYRITQKSIDLIPIFDLMSKFCFQWGSANDGDIVSWTTGIKRLLGSRWNARIIWLLFVLRSVRFNELKNSIEGISFKMLTQQLRFLEKEEVIIRKDFNENPPHVEYSLTEKGNALYNILLLIAQWNGQYGMKNGNMGTMNNIV